VTECNILECQNLLVYHVSIRLLNMLYYNVMEEEVAVYQNTERKVQLIYLMGAVAYNSNDMRTYTSAPLPLVLLLRKANACVAVVSVRGHTYPH